MLYSGLMELDRALNPRPALAETMLSRDRMLWHVRLRKGITFHDGKSLTAADMVFSLLRHNDPRVNALLSGDVHLINVVNPRPTVDMIFSLFYKSDATWNESGWNKPRFDRLLLEARGESDQAKRKRLYGEMQGFVRQHCGSAIPVFISLLDGHDRRVKCLYPVPLRDFTGYAFAEHVWWAG